MKNSGKTSTNSRVLVFYNGPVHTLDNTERKPTAVACVGGTIRQVGSSDDIHQRFPSPDRSVNLRGRTLVPGFIDSHIHLGRLSLDLRKIQLRDAESLSDALTRVQNRADDVSGEEWLQSACDWHENQLKEQRFPTRWELDDVSNGHPVILYRGVHNAVVNSEALKRAGIDEKADDPEGGHFVRDSNGRLTGWLQEDPAIEPVQECIPEPDAHEYKQAMKEGIHKLNSVGVTSIRDARLRPDDVRIYQRLYERGQLDVKATLCPFIAPDRSAEDELDMWGSMGISTGFGNERIRIGPLKMFADGGVETAMLTEDYANQPGYRGLAVTPRETIDTVIDWAGDHSWGVAIHAVGDRAIEQTLDQFRQHHSKFKDPNQPLCLEHGILMPRDRIDELNQLGVNLTVQTGHLYTLGSAWVEYFGESRANRLYPLRDLIDYGIKPGGGTDAPVTPYDTFISIASDMTRATNTGDILGENHSITPLEALKMHTKWAAGITQEHHLKGSIVEGKRADFAILSDDPLSVEPEQHNEISCEMTVLNGSMVYTTTPR